MTTLYKLDKDKCEIVGFEILRETESSWYVGRGYVAGGRVHKPKKENSRYFTDLKMAKKSLHEFLLEIVAKEEKRLLHLKMACDLLEEDDEERLRKGGVIRKARR